MADGEAPRGEPRRSPWHRHRDGGRAALAVGLLLLALARQAEAGPGLDCLACPTIDRTTCPALEGALATPAATTAELAAWLAKAPADATTVRRAAAVLSLIGGATAREALTTAASRFAGQQELEVDLWGAAARAGDPGARRALLRFTAATVEPRQRMVAISELTALGDAGALEPARAALGDGNARLAAAAARALGALGSRERDGPALVAALRGDRVAVPARIALLDACAKLKVEGAALSATLLVGHPHRRVGIAALEVLRWAPQRWAAPAIAWALDVEGLRAAAAAAAVAAADPNLGALTLRSLTSTVLPLTEHRALLDAVVVLRPEQAARSLLRQLPALDDAGRIATLQAIAQLGDRSAIPALVDTLPTARGDVANFTVAALETLTGERRGGDVAAWRGWLRGAPRPDDSAAAPPTAR